MAAKKKSSGSGSYARTLNLISVIHYAGAKPTRLGTYHVDDVAAAHYEVGADDANDPLSIKICLSDLDLEKLGYEFAPKRIEVTLNLKSPKQ